MTIVIEKATMILTLCKLLDKVFIDNKQNKTYTSHTE